MARGWEEIRGSLYEIIFEADTKAGRLFDLLLLWAIVVSVTVVILDSVEGINRDYGGLLWGLEWFFTTVFTVEYLLRLVTVGRPLAYAVSFFGVVDLLSILPSYLGLVLGGTHFLAVIRILRILRVFRVLKLARYIGAAETLSLAMKNSREKIIVFLEAVITLVIIVGSVMYLVEGPENGFTSIPRSIYWTIVTITTVGYGDIAPRTLVGQALASLLMITGYAIIAVPTGIITSEVDKAREKALWNTQVCQNCLLDRHDDDALYCKRCGARL